MKRQVLKITALILFSAMALLSVNGQSTSRLISNFDTGWKFSLGDNPKACDVSFNDNSWRTLDLPHDWSVEGTVNEDAPSTGSGGYYPDWKMIGTESSSAGGVRGGYSLLSRTGTFSPNYNTRMIRAEQLWKFVSTHSYVVGDFMWTGIDYLGEARWPSKSANSGVIDLCGFPKDGYYFYQSQWTKEPMVHIFPHWNWEGSEGQIIPVMAYSNCDAVELFLNGKSYGEKRLEFPRQGNSGSWASYATPPVNATTADLHLSWDVPYEPGTLKAVGKRGGEIVCTEIIETAGKPSSMRLDVDSEQIKADNQDVAHVKIEVIDDKGNIVPTADNLITYKVSGSGKLIGLENGNSMDHENYKSNKRSVFNGLGLAIVQAGTTPGKITVTASSEGMKDVTVEIVVSN